MKMIGDESKPFIWQNLNHQKRMKHLLETGHLSDCSFSVLDDNERIEIRCHKFVLMCCSPVFERMFYGDFDESRDSENIVLDDVSAGDFKTFIEYLYLHDKELAKLWDVCTLQTLIYLGKKFMVDDLTDLCFTIIIQSISKYSTEELINLYVFAHQMEQHNLIRKINLTCVNDYIKIFKSPSILDLSLELFSNFISAMSDFNDSICQVNLFNVIRKYCKEKGLTKEAPESWFRYKLCQTITEGDFDNEGMKILKSKFQFTAGNNTKEETEIEEKEALNDEKKMLQEVNKRKAKTEAEEKEALNQDQEKENKLDKEKYAQNKEYIGKLLSLVKFEEMTSSQFCYGLGLSSMIPNDLKYDILANLAINQRPLYNKFGGGRY